MRTIRSRWKWIRRELYLIVTLSLVILFPSAPGHVAEAIQESQVIGKVEIALADVLGRIATSIKGSTAQG